MGLPIYENTGLLEEEVLTFTVLLRALPGIHNIYKTPKMTKALDAASSEQIQISRKKYMRRFSRDQNISKNEF